MGRTRNNFGYRGDEVPLVPGVVYGARAWKYGFIEGGYLRSIAAEYTWSPGVNHSGCTSNILHHEAKKDCSCGFYAYFTGFLRHAQPHTIVGVIEAYGKIVFGDLGFRCSKARIKAIYNPWANGTPKSDLFYSSRMDADLANLYESMKTTAWDLGPQSFELIRDRYPDIPHYASVAKLIQDFPVTRYSEMESIFVQNEARNID